MTLGFDPAYAGKLEQEAEVWNRAAEQQAASTPPDWEYHRRLCYNTGAHAADVASLLLRVRPGMHVLDLGCNSGWLTLAMARRGARVLGLDVADRAIEIAQDYFDAVRGSVAGNVTYRVADLNLVELPAGEFDLVVARGVFHHLIQLDRLMEGIQRSLKPGGLLWASDPVGHVPAEAALLAGMLMLVLPTHVPLGQKLGAFRRFGTRSVSRVRASMEAEGGSPFEGIGRETDWVALLRSSFLIEWEQRHPAVTGYLAAQIALPDRVSLPVLKVIGAVDISLVRLGIVRSSGLTVLARKAKG